MSAQTEEDPDMTHDSRIRESRQDHPLPQDPALAAVLLGVMIQGASERFEDGYISAMAKHLGDIATRHGDTRSFLRGVDSVLDDPRLTSDVRAESLKVLGQQCEDADEDVRNLCMTVIARRLGSKDALVRDGALVALDNLQDERASDLLQGHALTETVSYLREYAENIVRSWGD